MLRVESQRQKQLIINRIRISQPTMNFMTETTTNTY